MATRVRIIRRNNAWWLDYYYRDESGVLRRKYERIGEGRKLAEAVAAKRQVEILEGKFLDRKRFKPITFKDYAAIFEERYLKFKPAYRTHRYRLTFLRDMLGHRQLNTISSFDVARIKHALYSRKTNRGSATTPATLNRYITLLKTMLNQAVPEYLPANPIKGLSKEKESERPIQPLSEEEIQRILSAAKAQSVEMYALILLALNTGLRTGDLLKLRMEDRWLSDRWLSVTMGKTQDVVNIPLNDEAIDAMKMLDRKEGMMLFPPKRQGSDIWKFRTSWLKLLRTAGIRRIRFYDLRHTFGTTLMETGAHPRAVQKLMGHKSLKTTERYIYVRDSLMVDAVKNLRKQPRKLLDTIWIPKEKQISTSAG